MKKIVKVVLSLMVMLLIGSGLFGEELNPPRNVQVNAETGMITWLEPGTGEYVELVQHDNTPYDGYYQNYDTGLGVVYDLSGYSDVTLEMVDFRHSSWGLNGTWDYKIHVVDWDTYTELAVIEGLQTTGDDKWETGINLGSITGNGLIGVFMEPMGNTSDDAYPCMDVDASLDGSSFVCLTEDFSANEAASGDFLMDLWIMASGSRQLVQAPRISVNSVSQAKTRMSSAPFVGDYVTVNQREYTRGLIGYNVYLDGTEVATNINALEYQLTGLNNNMSYTAGVAAVYDGGMSSTVEVDFTFVGTEANNDVVMNSFNLENYPNPFNPSTTISYNLDKAGNVTIEIYSIKGCKVRTLVNDVQSVGSHSVVWDGKDDSNHTLSSGVYFYRLKLGEYSATRKMIMMK